MLSWIGMCCTCRFTASLCATHAIELIGKIPDKLQRPRWTAAANRFLSFGLVDLDHVTALSLDVVWNLLYYILINEVVSAAERETRKTCTAVRLPQ